MTGCRKRNGSPGYLRRDNKRVSKDVADRNYMKGRQNYRHDRRHSLVVIRSRGMGADAWGELGCLWS